MQHVPSDDNLPAVPEENFTQKREVTVDSYSESISSNDESSDDRTITMDSDSSTTSGFEVKHLVNGKMIARELRLPFTK